jgi:hypothetical protein
MSACLRDHALPDDSSNVRRVVSLSEGATKDGGTPESVFEAGEPNSPNAVTKENPAEIGADFMTKFTTCRSVHSKHGNFGRRPFRSAVCFSDTAKGPLRQILFVVLLPERDRG